MRQLGRLVARMHLQGETGRFEHRPAIDIDTYGSASHDYLLEQGFIPDELQQAYEGIAEHLSQISTRVLTGPADHDRSVCMQIFIRAMCWWQASSCTS